MRLYELELCEMKVAVYGQGCNWKVDDQQPHMNSFNKVDHDWFAQV